jgi:hypothetical protein
MLVILIAVVLLGVSVVAIYLLLKNMGRDGIEAAAPGSCRSGRCGVQPAKPAADADLEQPQYVQLDAFKRKDAVSNKPLP